MTYLKPQPTITDDDRPFWDAAREHRFVLPRCRACAHVWFPPYASCPSCLSFDREFFEASGRGRIWGYTIMQQPYLPGFREELPYNVVLVQLDEGPMIYSNVVGIDNDSIACDMPVEVVFDDVTEDLTLLKVRPIA